LVGNSSYRSEAAANPPPHYFSPRDQVASPADPINGDG